MNERVKKQHILNKLKILMDWNSAKGNEGRNKGQVSIDRGVDINMLVCKHKFTEGVVNLSSKPIFALQLSVVNKGPKFDIACGRGMGYESVMCEVEGVICDCTYSVKDMVRHYSVVVVKNKGGV